jgi:hypothetical protein
MDYLDLYFKPPFVLNRRCKIYYLDLLF